VGFVDREGSCRSRDTGCTCMVSRAALQRCDVEYRQLDLLGWRKLFVLKVKLGSWGSVSSGGIVTR